MAFACMGYFWEFPHEQGTGILSLTEQDYREVRTYVYDWVLIQVYLKTAGRSTIDVRQFMGKFRQTIPFPWGKKFRTNSSYVPILLYSVPVQ